MRVWDACSPLWPSGRLVAEPALTAGTARTCLEHQLSRVPRTNQKTNRPFFQKGLDTYLQRSNIVTVRRSGYCGEVVCWFGHFKLFLSFILYQEVGIHVFSVWGFLEVFIQLQLEAFLKSFLLQIRFPLQFPEFKSKS